MKQWHFCNFFQVLRLGSAYIRSRKCLFA